MSQQVIVGTVGRPHGLRGEVTVRPRTDRIEERFAVGAEFLLNGRALTVASHNLTQGRLVVAFVGVSDRVGAEALRGADLWATSDDEPLAEDEYADIVLIGSKAVDPSGELLGEVIGVHHHPSQDLLVVRTAAGERLVPFVTELVPEVDPANRRLVINPIPGLLSEVPDAD
jgi:16S rRNA processing protein RimM